MIYKAITSTFPWKTPKIGQKKAAPRAALSSGWLASIYAPNHRKHASTGLPVSLDGV